MFRGSLGVILAIVGALLIPSSGLATSSHPGPLVAPFAGGTSITYYGDSYGGCSGTVKFVKHPFWSNATGVGGFAYATRAKACTSKVPGSTVSYGSANGQFELAIPIHIAKSGNHVITVNWTISLNASESLSTGTCPAPTPPYSYSYCSASTYTFLAAYAYLRDQTNGTIVPPLASWGAIYEDSNNQSSINCYGGSCSYSYTFGHSYSGGPFNGNGSFAWVLNATARSALNATHHYQLLVTVYANSYVGESGYLAGIAVSNLDMATNGHGWKLNSIKVA